MADYRHGDSRRRTEASIQPGPNTTRRSWSNGGMHFTMETTTYTMPGGYFSSFSTSTDSSNRGFAASRRNNQPRASGILGNAFSLLGDVLASSQAAQQRSTRDSARRDSKQARVDDDLAFGDEDEVFEAANSKPRSIASKLAGRIINNSQRSPKTHLRRETSPDQDASRRPKQNGRSRSYRTEERRQPWPASRGAMVEDTSDEDDSESESEDSEDSYSAQRRDSRRVFPQTDTRRGSVPHQRTAHRSQPRRAYTATEHIFTPSPGPHFFFGTSSTRRPSHPFFDDDDDFGFHTSFGGLPFGGFERIFNEDSFFAMPRSTFAGASSTVPNSGPQSRPTRSPPIFTPPPTSKPPANLLRPEEAKRLFQSYNTRWNALAPTDPNIPYPCRGMKSTALTTRDTLWAPLVSSPISTWSDETVMQANAQAFFLGVAGLVPKYTEAPGTGRIVMGYDKAKANPEQLRALVDVLKKEKTRWHSDKLGRRNGGVATGPNENLQRDERARAVFHAVCELMDCLP